MDKTIGLIIFLSLILTLRILYEISKNKENKKNKK